MMTETILLSKSDIEQCIDIRSVAEIVEQTFRAHGQKRVVMPAKITLDMSVLGVPNWMNAMPAYVESANAFGVKFAGGFIHNPAEHHLPYVMGMLLLHDPHTGVPLAVMDATHITNLRTGASAAVAARYLARRDARVAAFIGCGVQAWTSLQALCALMEIREVRAADIRPRASERLANYATELGMQGLSAGDNHEAVDEADIIVVATTANEPLVKREWVKAGAFIAKMGSYQELEDALTLSADKVVVDHREQAEHRGELAHLFESGQFKQEDIFGEMGDIVAGLQPGRETDEEIIIAELVGLGSEDVAVGSEVVRRARQQNIGTRFNFLA